jgi:hypothetical protein
MSEFIVGWLPALGELTAVYHNFERLPPVWRRVSITCLSVGELTDNF